MLLGSAAALGLIAGVCGGYLVQADREPTRLPSLAQAPAQAEGDAPEPLSPATDRLLRTEGDLRKLLLKKPAGAKEAAWLESTDGWMDMAAYADFFAMPDEKFTDLVKEQFRRAAVTGWEVGNEYTVEIRLVQFRQEETLGAANASESQQTWASWDASDSWVIPGSGNGMAYVHEEPAEDGYGPVYSAEAHAWRGDVAMEIWVYGAEPLKKEAIMELAERQVERL